jgi:hypothetical protein
MDANITRLHAQKFLLSFSQVLEFFRKHLPGGNGG